MDEQPKNIWKKSLKPPGFFLAWLIVVVATFLVFVTIGELFGNVHNWSARWPALFETLVASLIVATVAFGLWLFIRWLCCWRNFKRFLFGLACFATLIALLYVEEDWRGKHDWENFKHQWEAKGEKFDFASVVPPAVPDEQNFAMAPIWVESMKAVLGPKNSRQWFGENYAENGRTNFTDRLEMPLTRDRYGADWPTNAAGNWQKATRADLKPWQDYYRNLAATTNLFPVAPQPQTPAQDVLLALGKYDSNIEELRQAARRAGSRFPAYSDADHPFDTLLPHLAALKSCTQVLRLHALAELQCGQSGAALDDVNLMLRLADSIRTEPFLISHLVRIAMLQITLQPIYEGLANHQWSDAQLATLDLELAKLDFLADYQLSMRGERACSISALDYMCRSRKVEGMDSQGIASKVAFLVPSAFFYQNELTIARMHQQCSLPMADPEHQIVSPTQVRSMTTRQQQELDHHAWPYKLFARMLLPAFDSAVKKFAYAQASVDLARTAIALERCRLAHGEFPETLDALAPQFIAQVPHDVIGGGPLKYRRTSDGQFVLYSVGWNETDDGGVVILKKDSSAAVDISQGDWVWRYPQKE